MDLPGYGRSEGKVDSALREVFLKGIIDRLKLSRPIVISPSMSGSFSVPLVLDDPSKLSALVSVAAVRVSKLANVDWSAINVMALYVTSFNAAALGSLHSQNIFALSLFLSLSLSLSLSLFHLPRSALLCLCIAHLPSLLMVSTHPSASRHVF